MKVGDKVGRGFGGRWSSRPRCGAAPRLPRRPAAPPAARAEPPLGPSAGACRSRAAPEVRADRSLPAREPTAPPCKLPHASPSIRKLRPRTGRDAGEVTGSGPKGRITQNDVQDFVKGGDGRYRRGAARRPAGVGGAGRRRPERLLPWPLMDFSKFGPTETLPLSRIKKISGPNLHRNWVMIPHVTQFDEADVTDLEAFRVDDATRTTRRRASS